LYLFSLQRVLPCCRLSVYDWACDCLYACFVVSRSVHAQHAFRSSVAGAAPWRRFSPKGWISIGEPLVLPSRSPSPVRAGKTSDGVLEALPPAGRAQAALRRGRLRLLFLQAPGAGAMSSLTSEAVPRQCRLIWLRDCMCQRRVLDHWEG